jgi:hypothetical protein
LFDAAPHEFGSKPVIAGAALVVGLLIGFAAGYVTADRPERGVPSSSTVAFSEESASVTPSDSLAQSYTDNPVAEVPPAATVPAGATPPPPRVPAIRPAIQVRRGALAVDSRPRGAEVLLDGRRVGMTPLLLNDVPSGTHAVRIVLPDYRRWATSVSVTAGARARVAASLER